MKGCLLPDGETPGVCGFKERDGVSGDYAFFSRYYDCLSPRPNLSLAPVSSDSARIMIPHSETVGIASPEHVQFA
jgi:hypothetical protein